VISSDLNILANLLNTEGICSDTSALQRAINLCYNVDHKESYRYDFGSLEFTPDQVGGVIPFGAEDLKLKFSISIGINKCDETIICDPLNKLEFNIEIFGLYMDELNQCVRDLYCSWHLDKHIEKEGDLTTKYSHPHYHFCFGGRNMEENNHDYGACLILPSPRFAYPPMDAILGIDFILQNYIHKDKTNKILNNSEYKEIIIKSQERLWKPYFSSIASRWSDNFGLEVNPNYSFSKLLPFIN